MLTKGSTHRRPVGRRQAGRGSWIVGGDRRREGVGAVRWHLHVADETEPLRGDGADQLLVLPRRRAPAGGVDAAGQGGIRHDPAPQTEAMRSSLLTRGRGSPQ